MAVAVVPVASKDIANGATPVKRLGTVATDGSVMAVAVPVVVVVQFGTTPPPLKMTPKVGPGVTGVPAGGTGGGTKVVVMLKLVGVGAMTVLGPLRAGIDDPAMTMGAPLVNVLLATTVTWPAAVEGAIPVTGAATICGWTTGGVALLETSGPTNGAAIVKLGGVAVKTLYVPS